MYISWLNLPYFTLLHINWNMCKYRESHFTEKVNIYHSAPTSKILYQCYWENWIFFSIKYLIVNFEVFIMYHRFYVYHYTTSKVFLLKHVYFWTISKTKIMLECLWAQWCDAYAHDAQWCCKCKCSTVQIIENPNNRL